MWLSVAARRVSLGEWGILWRGKPLLRPCLSSKELRDSHHLKINVCESICAPLYVCQGFVRQISPACAALVLLNRASITRPLWIMQGRLLLTYSAGCSACVLLCVHARVTGWSFSPLANATGQLFDVPPLGPLNLVSDTGTPTLILCECASAVAGGLYSRQEELNSVGQLRPALWHALTHYVQSAHGRILRLRKKKKKTIRYEVRGASLTHRGKKKKKTPPPLPNAHRRKSGWACSSSYPQVCEAEILITWML